MSDYAKVYKVYAAWRDYGGDEETLIGLFWDVPSAREAIAKDLDRWTVPVGWRISVHEVDGHQPVNIDF